MIQAVVTPEHRGDMGMHYTSVPNIMKVIQPLFLDELNEEFEKNKTNKKKLQKLLVRISNLKIFDPACVSGNFLIIAYKELRVLEMKILKAIDDLSSQKSFSFSEIKLTQFYGKESIKEYEEFINIFYGKDACENIINLTKIRDYLYPIPVLPINYDRRLILTQYILSYAYLLTQLSIKHLDSKQN